MSIVLPSHKNQLSIEANQGKVVIRLTQPSDTIILDPGAAAQIARTLADVVQHMLPNNRPRILKS